MVKKNNKFGLIGIVSGIILMFASYLAFLFIENGFISEVHSEVFGVGTGLLLLGIIYSVFKLKLG